MTHQKVSLFDQLFTTFSKEAGSYLPSSDFPETANYEIGRDSYYQTGRNMAIVAQLASFYKRYTGSTSRVALSDDERALAARHEFLNDNKRCEEFNSSFSFLGLPAHVQEILGSAIYSLDKNLKPVQFSYDRLASALHSGPGASADAEGLGGSYRRLGNSAMSFTSPSVKRLYTEVCAYTRLTYLNEKVRSNVFGSVDVVESNAVFSTAPKSNVTDRGICKHPTGNMALGLATHTVVQKVLTSCYSVDITTQQEYNKQLARLGSMGPTRVSWKSGSHGHDTQRLDRLRFCTVDLKSASNYPLVVAETMFPPWFFEWLMTIRSPNMTFNERGKDPMIVPKHMLSTMGNGSTFAVMTLLLTAIVVAIYKAADIPLFAYLETGERIKTFGVYGDDIVVDKSVVSILIECLNGLGFIVNETKSFSTGFFRESCGGDYYDGYDVRPVFCEKLQTQAHIYSYMNRLARWGCQHSVDLPLTLGLLYKAAKKLGHDLRVPCDSDVCSGLHVPHDCALPTVRPKSRLEGIAYRALLPVTMHERIVHYKVGYKAKYTPIQWRFGLNVPFLVFPEGVTAEELHCTVYEVNSLNLISVLTGIMRGEIRDGRLSSDDDSFRQNTVFKPAIVYTPSWGNIQAVFSCQYSHLRVQARLSSYLVWSNYVRSNIFARQSLS